MERLVTSFFDATKLGPDTAQNCAFRAVIGTDGLSYSVMEQRTRQLLALKSWIFTTNDVDLALRRILSSESPLDYIYNDTQIMWFNAQVTLVPRRLFDPLQVPSYFQLLLEPGEYGYGATELPEQDCYVAHAIEPLLARQTQLYFPNHTAIHQSAKLLRLYSEWSDAKDANVWLNLRNNYIQVAVFERQKLLFYNAFEYQKPNDVLYFVLLAYEQAKLKPASVPLNITGTILEDSEVYRALHRFIRHILFANPTLHMTLPTEITGYYHVDLLC
jgi:hypothetical protein